MIKNLSQNEMHFLGYSKDPRKARRQKRYYERLQKENVLKQAPIELKYKVERLSLKKIEDILRHRSQVYQATGKKPKMLFLTWEDFYSLRDITSDQSFYFIHSDTQTTEMKIADMDIIVLDYIKESFCY